MKNPLIDAVVLSHKLCLSPIECHLAYATNENFLGRIVHGYHKEATSLCLMTKSAATALCHVQNKLNKQKLGLFVFDSYRPLRAVKDFGLWMQTPSQGHYEEVRKQIHYPHIEKNELSILGYVADCVSNHCFGDTIDLSLIDLNTKQLLDMGACFDFFDEISYPSAPPERIGVKAYENRLILANAMAAEGFQPYSKEFWHYTFQQRDIQEPLDLEITPALVGLGNS